MAPDACCRPPALTPFALRCACRKVHGSSSTGRNENPPPCLHGQTGALSNAPIYQRMGIEAALSCCRHAQGTISMQTVISKADVKRALDNCIREHVMVEGVDAYRMLTIHSH